MRKKLFAMMLAAAMLGTSFSAMASETEAPAEAVTETAATEAAATEAVTEAAAEETVERNHNPEAGTGWLTVDINGEPEEFELKYVTIGLTGKTCHFESDGYTMSFILSKDLAVGETMGTNSIYQIDLLSSEEATSGYYFAKKTVKADVDSEVTLSQKTEDGLVDGTFKVTVNSAERYVGDARPGIQESLVLENGEFCFHE